MKTLTETRIMLGAQPEASTAEILIDNEICIVDEECLRRLAILIADRKMFCHQVTDLNGKELFFEDGTADELPVDMHLQDKLALELMAITQENGY